MNQALREIERLTAEFNAAVDECNRLQAALKRIFTMSKGSASRAMMQRVAREALESTPVAVTGNSEPAEPRQE